MMLSTSPSSPGQETIEDIDKNGDGYVQVDEYIGECVCVGGGRAVGH